MSYTFQDGQILCPYNASHVLTQMRSLTHLVKCRKAHPELAQKISICPYNQGHHIPLEGMQEHLKACKEFNVFQAFRVTAVSGSETSIASNGHPNKNNVDRVDPNITETKSQVDSDIDEWM